MYYGKAPDDAPQYRDDDSSSRSPINEAEALRVDRALCKLPRLRVDDRKGNDLLAYRYLTPWVSLSTHCRRLHITVRQGRELRSIAKGRLEAILFSYNFDFDK